MTYYNVYAINPDRRFHVQLKDFSEAESQAKRLVEELGYPRAEVCVTHEKGETPVFEAWMSATNQIETKLKDGWKPGEEA